MPGKSRRNGRTSTNFAPIPLQDTKVQRKYQKRKQNSGNFYRKIVLRLLWRNRNILRHHVRPLRRAHTVANWCRNVLIYSFVIRMYLQLQAPVTQSFSCNNEKVGAPYRCNHKTQSFRINVTQYTFLIYFIYLLDYT